MKITRSQLRRLLRESVRKSPWFQDAPDIVKKVHTQGSEEQWQKKFGDNASTSNPARIHPSRQIASGNFDVSGIEYWENRIVNDINKFGLVPLD